MWKPGSMGHAFGWHHGQFEHTMHEMHEHAHRWWGEHGDDYDGENPLSDFLGSFAARIGEHIADHVTGDSSS